MLGTVLVTGVAGFIGSFLCRRLVEDGGCEVTGLDNVNSYYDPGIKEDRLRMLHEADVGGRFTFVRGDLTDAALVERLFAEGGFDVVVNLAAQAGVRYSTLFGFPASATQLRSSAGLDCRAVLVELLGGDVQPARPHHGEPIGPGGSELRGVGELLEDAVSDDFGHVIGTAAAVVKLKVERCVIYRPRLADVVFHG